MIVVRYWREGNPQDRWRLGAAADPSTTSWDSDPAKIRSVLSSAERGLITNDNQLLDETAVLYGLNAARLKTHTATLADYAATRQLPLSRLEDVRQLLRADIGARVMLTEVVSLVKVLLTVPATSCTAEPSFSLLRRVKNWLRATMTQQRLNAAAMCATYPEELRSLDVSKLVVVDHRWRIVYNCGCQDTHRGWRTPITSKTDTHSEPPTPIAPISVSRKEKSFSFCGTVFQHAIHI